VRRPWPPARGRQDRHQQRQPRQLVRRLDRRPPRRGLGRQRPEQAHRPVWRHGCDAGVVVDLQALAERAAGRVRQGPGLAVGGGFEHHRRRLPGCAALRLRCRLRARLPDLPLQRAGRGRWLAQLVRLGRSRRGAGGSGAGTGAATMMSGMRIAAIAACMASLLAACASDGGTFAVPSGVDPEAMVAQIRAAAGQDDTELAVQPLRDPMVEDLREQAVSLEQQRRYADAVAALEQALELVPDDPALLQERAEAAVLVGDFATAARLAKRAWDLGAKVGPLCRRHWETLRQLRLVAGDAPGVASAQVQSESCTVAGPARY